MVCDMLNMVPRRHTSQVKTCWPAEHHLGLHLEDGCQTLQEVVPPRMFGPRHPEEDVRPARPGFIDNILGSGRHEDQH